MEEIRPHSDIRYDYEQLLDFDVNRLQQELLGILRNGASTRDMSQRLGYSFDQYARWEAGRVRLKWSHFTAITELRAIDLPNLFFRIFGFLPKSVNNAHEFTRELLRGVVGPTSHREIAKALSVSEDLVDRWMYGRSEIAFVEVCLVLRIFTGQAFFAWIDGLVAGKTLSSLQNVQAAQKAEQSVHLAFPFASAVEAALQLEAYKKSERPSMDQISQLSGLSQDLIVRVLPILESVGRVKRNGDKYEVIDSVVNVQGGTRLELSRLTRYWTERALARFQTKDGLPVTKRNNPNAVMFRVAPLSKKATLAVTEAMLKCHNEISKIIADDTDPADEIRVIVGHHFSSDESF